MASFTEEDRTQIPTIKPFLLERHAYTVDKWHQSPFPAVRGADSDGTVPQDTFNSRRNNGTSVPTEKQICVWHEQWCFPTWGFHLALCYLLMICTLCHAVSKKGERCSAGKGFIQCLPALPRHSPLSFLSQLVLDTVSPVFLESEGEYIFSMLRKIIVSLTP